MKHVIVLNQFALPRTEGGGTRHIDLFSRLDGWQPLIVAGNRNHYSQKVYRTGDDRFRLVGVPEQRGGAAARICGWTVYSLRAFGVIMTCRRVDLVYGSLPHLLAPVVGLLAARLRRVPFVLEVRDLWPESIVAAGLLRAGGVPHRFLSALEKYVATRAASVVVVTPGWKDHFAQLGVAEERLVVVPNGTEVTDDAPPVRSRATGRLRAIFAGAHGPKDGLDYILDAAASLPELDVVLVGDGPAKAAAVEQAVLRGLDNVVFLDPLPKQELPALLAAADIGIHAVTPLPVFAKGMSPNKLFDYMAAGLPVVSNAGAGVATLVPDGECGRIGGPDSLAAGLRDVCEAGSEQRERWGRRGAEIVVDRYSRTAAAARLRALLNEAIPGDAEGSGGRRRHTVAHLSTAHRADDNRILRKECVALREAGIDVCLVANHPHDDTIDGVPVVALPRRVGRLRRMILGPVDVWRTVHRVRPRLIHVHDPELIPLALLWRLWPGRAAIYDAHEDLPKQVMGKPYIPTPLRAIVARFAGLLEHSADVGLDAVVVATPSIRRNFRNPNTTLVQNFPWLRAFPAPRDPPADAPATVSYVGGITRERGGREMIEGVRGSDANAELVLAGPATDEMLAAMSESKSLGVRYLGRLRADRVPAVVADSRIGLVLFHPLPNHIESQPTKLFEYMAAGRPFIASDFAHWRGLVGDAHCGSFVDPFDTTALSAAIDDLLRDPGLAAAMGRAGRRAVEEKFSFETQAPALILLTQELEGSR